MGSSPQLISRPPRVPTLACMRCQVEMPLNTAFCPECGAPQLRVTEDEIAAAAAALAGSNAPRPPDMTLIQWPAAVYVSLICGAGVGVLCSLLVGGLQVLLLLWVLGGAVAAVTLYSRRFPRASVGGSVGARLGILCGLFAASISTLLTALVLAAQRFLFGQGREIDSAMDEMVRQLGVISLQISPPGQQNPYLTMVKAPEGHAVLLVTAMIGTFVLTMLLSMLSGAASGHYVALRRKRLQSVPQ